MWFEATKNYLENKSSMIDLTAGQPRKQSHLSSISMVLFLLRRSYLGFHIAPLAPTRTTWTGGLSQNKKNIQMFVYVIFLCKNEKLKLEVKQWTSVQPV